LKASARRRSRECTCDGHLHPETTKTSFAVDRTAHRSSPMARRGQKSNRIVRGQYSRTLAPTRFRSTSSTERQAKKRRRERRRNGKKRERAPHASSSSSRSTYEILHRPAINHRRHEDSKNRKRPDRSRRQPKPTLDEFPRESVGLDERVLFHPRRVVSRHRRSNERSSERRRLQSVSVSVWERSRTFPRRVFSETSEKSARNAV
jgi:hypothetical protein